MKKNYISFLNRYFRNFFLICLINFLFCGLVLEMLENCKNEGNFCGDKNVLLWKFFFEYFFLIVPESLISDYFQMFVLTVAIYGVSIYGVNRALLHMVPSKLVARFETEVEMMPSVEPTLAHLQNYTEIEKKWISEVIVLVKVVLVLSTTNSTSECSFNMLRLIKSYLWSRSIKII